MKKIYLIAVVVALVTGVATYIFANELKTSKIVTGVDDATVLIALADIDENTILTESMFQSVKLPVTAVSPSTVSDTKFLCNILLGKAPFLSFIPDQFAHFCLMLGKIIPIGQKTDKGKLSYQLKKGMYAYSVGIGIENGVSYFIKENDKVNIYDVRSPSAQPLLENVRVLKISDYPANIQQNAGVEITSYPVMTLELTKEQIAKMMTVDTSSQNDALFRAVLVSHIEAYGLDDDIANADVPENQRPEPQTNYGMGELTPAPPTTESE